MNRLSADGLPWKWDAPDGFAWQCPNCPSAATLGGNAAYHATQSGHLPPKLLPWRPPEPEYCIDARVAAAASHPLLDEIGHLREQLEAADKRNGELSAENAVLRDRIEQGWRSSPTREICSECARLSAVGFHVPDRIWAAAIPPPRREDIFCLQCFSRLADRAYVAWDREIAFYPVSKRTHREIVQGAGREMVERIAVLEGEIREYERSTESANKEIRNLKEGNENEG